MATTTSITTTYAGEYAGKYIAPALLSGNTLSQGAISIMPNVKYKAVIKKLSTDGIVKDATCDFTDTSTITTVERILTPDEQQVNLELCKKDHHSDWEAVQMGYSAHDQIPPNFGAFLLEYVSAKVAQKTEQNIWGGIAASAGEFDGFVELLTNDANLPSANEVAGTSITSSNVVAQLGAIKDAIPNAVKTSGECVIYCAINIADAYIRALGGFGASGLGAAGVDNKGPGWYNGQPLVFEGIPMFVAPGLADNVAIAAEKSNLWFGTGLMADHNQVKVLDMADLDGSDNVRIVMRFTAGVQYGAVEDIVTYGIVNPNN